MKSPLFEKKVVAWALYDWANSAFATTVMVAFFPVFFKQTLAAGMAPTTSTVWFGTANGISSLVLALTAPWLGALADKGSAHVRMLAIFTAVGAVPTALLAFVDTADTFTGLTLFVIASVGFWGGLIFYDSMLIRVAPPGRVQRALRLPTLAPPPELHTASEQQLRCVAHAVLAAAGIFAVLKIALGS